MIPFNVSCGSETVTMAYSFIMKRSKYHKTYCNELLKSNFKPSGERKFTFFVNEVASILATLADASAPGTIIQHYRCDGEVRPHITLK